MKYVALLRGINVGGNKKVEMTKLKEEFEKLGFQNVSTYINSGNVIFDSKITPDPIAIQNHISNVFEFDIKMVVKSEREIINIHDEIPVTWNNNKEEKTDIIFLWKGFDTKERIDDIQQTDVDTLIYTNKVIIWHIRKKDYSKSGMNTFIGTEVYKNMTARNVNTVRKIYERMTKKD